MHFRRAPTPEELNDSLNPAKLTAVNHQMAQQGALRPSALQPVGRGGPLPPQMTR